MCSPGKAVLPSVRLAPWAASRRSQSPGCRLMPDCDMPRSPLSLSFPLSLLSLSRALSLALSLSLPLPLFHCLPLSFSLSTLPTCLLIIKGRIDHFSSLPQSSTPHKGQTSLILNQCYLTKSAFKITSFASLFHRLSFMWNTNLQ